MPSRQPNVLFILMDDLGWRDLTCYGSDFYETPHLDRLATRGMRFTDAYAACPVCSPTRASLLSGKYPARVGVTNWIDHEGTCHPWRGRLIDAPYLKQLPQSEYCLARALKAGGYRTWHVGKWHLGGAGFYPQDHGFDVNIGGCEWGHPRQGYFSPWGIRHLFDGPTGEYLPDRLTDEAVKLIRENDGTPFFLNFWDYLVHTPIQGKPADVEYFKVKSARLGLDKIPALEAGEFLTIEGMQHQRVVRRRIQSDPIYAAMVKAMDDNLGRLLAALEETGQTENTLVIFTSDNGGLANTAGSPTTNRPLQEGKGWMYDGGVREPLIVCWPGRVAAGSVCQTPVSSPDFYPTLLAAADLPARPEQHVDGESFLPLLTGTGDLRREAIYWHYPHYHSSGSTPGAAIRAGDYKLIEFFENNRIELYDVRRDLGEEHDLAGSMPELAARLRGMLHAWQAEVVAQFPAVNPESVAARA